MIAVRRLTNVTLCTNSLGFRIILYLIWITLHSVHILSKKYVLFSDAEKVRQYTFDFEPVFRVHPRLRLTRGWNLRLIEEVKSTLKILHIDQNVWKKQKICVEKMRPPLLFPHKSSVSLTHYALYVRLRYRSDFSLEIPEMDGRICIVYRKLNRQNKKLNLFPCIPASTSRGWRQEWMSRTMDPSLNDSLVSFLPRVAAKRLYSFTGNKAVASSGRLRCLESFEYFKYI